MKKDYQQPRLYAESFALLEHISSCTPGGSTSVNYRDRNSCSYADAGVSLFLSDGGDHGCNVAEIMTVYDYGDGRDPISNYLASLDSEIGGGCYNAFTDGHVFAS